MSKILLFDTTQKLPPSEAPQLEGPLNKLRVYFQPADDAACGNYRCIFPAEALRKLGAKVKWAYRLVASDLSDYDVFIFQRPMSEEIAKHMRQLKGIGKVVIVELDDNLHNVPVSSPVYDHYKPSKLKYLTECIKNADGLIVSTPELAEFYYQMNPVIGLAYNSIDFNLGYRDWSGEKQGLVHPGEDTFVLGWRGGISVDEKTEILTEKGFMFFKDLLPTIKVAQYNPEKNEIEYVLPIRTTENLYTGTMYTHKKGVFSLTDNHRVYKSYETHNEFERMKDIVGNFSIPLVLGQIKKKRSNVSDAMLYLLGLCVSQGKPFKKDLMISFPRMKSSEDLEFTESILKELNITFFYVNNILTISFPNKDLFNELYSGVLRVNLPKVVIDANPEQVRMFVRGLVSSKSVTFNESHDVGNYKTYIIPIYVCNQIVSLCVNSGISVYLTEAKEGNAYLQYKNIKTLHIQKDSIAKTEVKDFTVYCVTVPTNIMCTRRNGFISWTGNSHMEDIKVLKPVLKPLMNKNSNLHLSFYSSYEFSKEAVKALDLNGFGKRVHLVKPRSFIEYPQGLAGPDAYVIPLSPNEPLFNSCKSELALAEVGAVKCPSVASSCAPYNRFADNNTYAITANPGEFYKSIQYLIDNRDAAKKLGEAAYYRTINNYNLDINCHYWSNAITSILALKFRGKDG